MRMWIASLWLFGGAFGGMFGCGLERIDFDPVPFVPDAGVDAGPPPRYPSPAFCFGDVTGCAGSTPSECEANPHCSYANACAPQPGFRCSSLREEGECRQVPGCRFDDLIDACTGVPAPGTCEGLSGPSCDVAAACRRVESPVCVPRLDCVHYPLTTCESVPGCSIRCPTADVACGDVCVDLATNTDHCGGCGSYCAGKCEGGACYAYAPCTNDIDCVGFDDGNRCTGVLVCVGGACQRTPAVTCDDGIECTSDRCDPATGVCRHDPRDGFCPSDQTCGAAGCTLAPSCSGGSCPTDEFCTLGPLNSYCRPTGEGVVGTSCDNGFDCVDDLQCVNVSNETDLLGVCGRGCSASSDCTIGERCLGGACSMRCRPLTTDTVCGPGLRCEISNQGVTLCVDGRRGLGDGGRCTDHGDCAHGHLCIIEGSVRTCRLVCELEGARACPSTYQCVGLEPALELYGREYGACLR